MATPSAVQRWTIALATCLCFSEALAQSTASPQAAASPVVAAALVFEVATIKPTDPHASGKRIEFRVNGFTARGITFREVIQEAFATYEENRLDGGPAWLRSDKFDIEAKFDASQTPGFRDLTLDERRAMLQELLRERLKLAVHRESRELPVYALLLAKNGSKLHETDAANLPDRGPVKGYALVTRSGLDRLECQNFTMLFLAQQLSWRVGRIVVDRTGLTGRYDFALRWTPDNQPASVSGEQPEALSTEPIWPSIFTALQEQLGLKLEPTKSPVDVVVIDRAERPSAN